MAAKTAIFFVVSPEVRDAFEAKFSRIRTTYRELFTFLMYEILEKSDSEAVDWFLAKKRTEFEREHEAIGKAASPE